MRIELAGGLELDDDSSRLDMDSVCAFVRDGAELGADRSRDQVVRMIEASWRVLGLYHEGRQVGFARAVSDGVDVAYLADVYVLATYRGRGLGMSLVREMVEGGTGPQLRWLLHTADATGMYTKLGFTELLRPRYRFGHFTYAPPFYPLMERDPVGDSPR
ncbi:MAG: GNAT family N-acetyltransferase [Solirubrobacteraceae bacterium]